MTSSHSKDFQVFDGKNGLNDQAYLAWLSANQNGFVMTSNRALTPRHTVIHESTCVLITRLSGKARLGGFTERAYIKICSNSLHHLEKWALQKRTDAVWRKCTRCFGK